MSSLENLRLKGVTGRLLFSQLFSLLYRSPALRTLTLHLTLPTIDLLATPSPVSSLPRLFPNGPLRGTRFKLLQLVYLSLNPAPPSNLALLFLLLDLPALEFLDLHIHTELPIEHSSTTVLPSAPSPSAQTVRLPSLRSLHVTDCITPVSASASASSASSSFTPTVPQTFPQLQHLAFPALADLRIAHAFVCDSSRAQDAETPQPPPPLRPLDALFHAPDSDFAHLMRLARAHCALSLGVLCHALQTRLPALVCALASGECDGEHESARGDVGLWVERGVREMTVVRCADVQAEGVCGGSSRVRLRASDFDTNMNDTSARGWASRGPSDAAPASALSPGATSCFSRALETVKFGWRRVFVKVGNEAGARG